MTKKESSQMSVGECRRTYQDIFSQHNIRPDAFPQLGDFRGRAVQKVCEAGPEVFTQWLKDHEGVHLALRHRYGRSLHPNGNNIEEDIDGMASQGAAVWNCWQWEKELADKKFGRNILEKSLYLSNIGNKNFNGFHFYQPVEIESNVDKEEISFRKATFKGNTKFGNLQNIKITDFTGAEFRQETEFKEISFNITIFNSVKFRNKISFERVSFLGGSFFDETEFFREVSFPYAQFHSDASFDKAKFLDTSSFINTQFLGTVSFESTKFWEVTNFEDVKFHAFTYFGKTEFNASRLVSKTTAFSGVEFSGTVDFENAEFSGDVEFFNTKFGKDALFKGVTCSRNIRFFGIANSSEYKFHGKLDFGPLENGNKTYFFKAPQFDIELPKDTEIIEAKFLGLAGDDISRRAYRTLKLEFSRRQAVREEQFFYRLEVKEEQEQLRKELKGQRGLKKNNPRKLEHKEFREKKWRWRFLKIYGAVADYGFSIRGPLWGLLGVFALWTVIYWISALRVDQPFPQNIKNALAISASYTLPPLVMEWRVREIVPKLFVSSSSNNLLSIITPMFWYLLLIIQRFISLALWFFIFLYWRNLARSK